MKKLSHMKTTQFIREQLGLSQESLAIYLSIRLSQLAMYETGKRDLPVGTREKLADILLFLNQNQKKFKQENELLNKQQSKVQSLIEKQLIELELKQIKGQRKLDAIQKKYKQSLKLNSFVTHLQNNKSKLPEFIQIQAFSGMEKNSLVAQTKQNLKLEGIKSQLAYVKSLKEK
jgi:transcriptional regulator with XRE-family HTH domain